MGSGGDSATVRDGVLEVFSGGGGGGGGFH